MQVPELKGVAVGPRAQRSGCRSESSDVWLQVLELGCLAVGPRARSSGKWFQSTLV
jgi:hypothetical protein